MKYSSAFAKLLFRLMTSIVRKLSALFYARRYLL